MKPAEIDVAIAYYVGVTGRDVADEFVPVWQEKLGELAATDVKAAIDRLAGGYWPPNIIQIRNAVLAELRFSSERLALPEPDGIGLDEWKATDEGRAAIEAARSEGVKSARQLEHEQELADA